MEKYWLLYSDKDQTKLLASAYEEDQLDFESQYYSKGCWFEYDIETSKNETDFLINERKYIKTIIFPKKPFDRPKHGDEYNQSWEALKSSMGERDIRETNLV